MALLRGLALFAPLAPPTVEQLARSLSRSTRAGEEVFRQGEPGDSFYVVEDGRVSVNIDGRHVSTVGPGGGFGEVALLRDVPRTATVRAEDDAELLALERDVFVAAVTGHPGSLEAANTAIGAYRLPALRTGSIAI